MSILDKKAYNRANYLANRERILESAKARAAAFRRDHPDILAARKKAFALRHREKIREYKRENYQKNAEKIKAKVSRWYYANQDRAKAYHAIQKARERCATIGDLTAIAKVYERCVWWRQWFDVVVDHIVPFAKSGSHEASNLQIIYASENLHKHAKLNYKPKVVFV